MRYLQAAPCNFQCKNIQHFILSFYYKLASIPLNYKLNDFFIYLYTQSLHNKISEDKLVFINQISVKVYTQTTEYNKQKMIYCLLI